MLLTPRQRLGVTMSFVEKKFQHKEFAEVDALLKNLSIENETILVLSGTLRVASRGKLVLKEWDATLERVKNEVVRREGEAKAREILVGLI